MWRSESSPAPARRSRRLGTAALLVGAALAVVPAGCGGRAVDDDETDHLREAEVIRLTRRLAPVLEQRLGGDLEVDGLTELVSGMGDRVSEAARFHRHPLDVVVVNHSVPGVVVGPQGPVFLTRGAVARCESAAVLAATVAHAAAHVALGHPVDGLREEEPLSRLRVAAGDGEPPAPGSPGLAELGAAAEAIIRTGYTAEQEREALSRSRELLQALEVDPDAALLIPGALAGDPTGGASELPPFGEAHGQESPDDAPDPSAIASEWDEAFGPVRSRLEAIQVGYAEYDEAERLRREGDYELAVQQYERACAIDSRQAPFYIGLGRCYLVLGNMSGAERVLLRASLLEEDLFAVQLWRGITSLSAGDHRAAVRQLRLASELDPTSPRPWYRLGLSYVEQNERRRAEEMLRTSIALAGDGEVARSARARLDELEARP